MLAPWLAVTTAAAPAAVEDSRFFEENVRPMLERSCFECHSHQSGKMKNGLTLDSRDGWATGGDAGPGGKPGDPDKSLLIKAVRHDDPELKMPPKRKLPDDEIAMLEEWVRRGAPDPRVSRGADSVQAAADCQHTWWSLRPLTRPVPPVDALIPSTLYFGANSMRLTNPAPEADRRTLIRRLTLDLHGLLPTPEEVDGVCPGHRPALTRSLSSVCSPPRVW